MKILKYIFSLPLIALIQFYRYFISPLTPASCRHVPTCSEYAIISVKQHGPLKGSVLAIKRLSKCHPWGTHGYDPVPKIIVKKYRKRGLKSKLHL
jgi:putative membrane protein insertion efficiency factor